MARHFNINYKIFYLLSGCFAIGMSNRQACKFVEISERTFYYWCKHIEGLKEDLYERKKDYELKICRWEFDDLEELWIKKYL